jgi:16S rRNA (guanine966-N2)-methyltransferase
MKRLPHDGRWAEWPRTPPAAGAEAEQPAGSRVVRVTGGELRGRRLAAPPGRSRAVRPTAERAREAIFSIVAGHLPDAQVLDLYCGTGALAIEALSRGAARAVLVDSDPRLARANVKALGIADRAEVIRADALRFLRRARRRFDLILCDPPYNIADRLEGDLDSLIPPRLAGGARVIVESSARRPLGLSSLDLEAERRYGEALVRVYREGR